MSTDKMSNDKTEYVYSIDGEGYIYDCLSDVIDSVENDLPEGESALGKTYYRGIARRPIASRFCPDAAHILEYMAERAYDDHGEYAEDFASGCTKEQEIELENFIKEWADKNLPVTFYGVIEAVELKLTAGDL